MAIPPGSPYQSFTATSIRLERVLATPCAISLALSTRGGAKPKLIEFQAVWDTGATDSVISPAVVAACGLKPIGMTQVHTSNATCLAEQYIVDIYLPNKVVFQDMRVTNQQLTGTLILIGMDIIGMGDFAVTNKDNKTTFSYRWPSGERIDFVKQAPHVVHDVGPSRNSPCPCGSGKKYKRCHGQAKSA